MDVGFVKSSNRDGTTRAIVEYPELKLVKMEHCLVEILFRKKYSGKLDIQHFLTFFVYVTPTAFKINEKPITVNGKSF